MVVNSGVSTAKLAMVWVLLLLITWVIPVTIALQKVVLTDDDTGAVLVIFPIDSTANENFDRIVQAKGAFVSSIFQDQAWIVYSYDPGFVRRLKDKGAWAVFDAKLLDPLALISCAPFPRR